MIHDDFKANRHDTMHEQNLENEHDIFRFGFLLNSNLHKNFEELVIISRLKTLHESCSTMSLVNFGASFSLIGQIELEI